MFNSLDQLTFLILSLVEPGIKIRTAKYGWTLAVMSWILAIGWSAQAMFSRTVVTYIHNQTFMGKSVLQIPAVKCKKAEFTNGQCELERNNSDNECLLVPVPDVSNATIFLFEMCVWNFSTEANSRQFLIRKFVFGFLLPFIVIAFSYVCIYLRLAQLSRSHRLNSDHLSRARKLNRSAVRTNTIVLLVVVSFFSAWLLNHGLNLFMIIVDPIKWPPGLFSLAPISMVR